MGLALAAKASAGAQLNAEQVRRWLSDTCPGSDGHRESCRVEALGHRSNSRLFFARCPLLSGPLFVKLCLKPNSLEPDVAAARRQYDSLLRVSGAMGEENECSVPRPYNLLGETAAFAMEWVPGRSVTGPLQACRGAARCARLAGKGPEGEP